MLGAFPKRARRGAGFIPFVAPLLALLLCVPSHGAAAEPSAQGPERERPAGDRSPLEQSLIDQALSELHLEEDHAPEGKVIEDIQVYVYEVFDERDPIPDFVNIFHVRTRDWVVEQEVLQSRGETFNHGKILETERNLRSLRQVSLANVVATRGSSPDKVRLLVIVKDVWSLRLNSSWAFGSSGLDSLVLNPTEENLAGIRATLGIVYSLERDRYSIGGNFAYPRLLGTRYSLGFSSGVFKNRFDGEVEGNYGTFSFQRPLFSRHTPWAYGATGEWLFEKSRRYTKGQLDQVVYTNELGEEEVVPWVYETAYLSGDYGGVRSFGILHKLDLSYGLLIDARRYTVPDAELYSQEALEHFEEVALPTSDRRYDPYVGLSSYKTQFHRVLNLETLSLQEDFRLGYGVSTSLFAGARELGSSRDHVGSSVSVGYTLPLGSGLVRAGLSNRVVVANENKNEGFFSARARVVVPVTFVGKLHLDGYFGYRYADYLNVSPFYLGGDNRLRGYPAGALRGKNLAAANAEFRTRGVDILSAQVGLAAFYDLGAAADEVPDLAFYQGLGGGVRILFPQAERTVLRLDWGFPVGAGIPAFPGAFFFTFGQAFSMPNASGGGTPY